MESLFDALDLPPQAQALQDAYWQARREWVELDAAYHRTLHDLLQRGGHKLPPTDTSLRCDEIPA